MSSLIQPADENSRRQQEFEAFQALKDKSLNALASGVAHDLNNAIAGILGCAEFIKLETGPGHPADEFVEQIFQAGERVREMVHQLKHFSQRKPCLRILTCLPPVVDECLQRLQSVIPHEVALAGHIERDCPAVFADADEVQRAVMNLCLHSWHSLPAPVGRINVRLDTCELSGQAAGHCGLRTSRHVRISVHDSSHALPMSGRMLERVFEPFTQTNLTGKKNGLELFNVEEIMRAHQGAAVAESNPDGSAMFRLYFPVPI